METKVCSKCNVGKPLGLFTKRSDTRDGKATRCKSCDKAYRATNREHINEQHRKYHQAHKGVSNSRRRDYHHANKDHSNAKRRLWYEENKEHSSAANRVYKQTHRGQVNASDAKRRATKLNATVAWADQEAIKCIYEEAKYFQMHVDHIVPLQHPLVCGLHCEANLQLLTPFDNLSKGNKFNPETYIDVY